MEIVWQVGNEPEQETGWFLVTLLYIDSDKRIVHEAWYNRASIGKWWLHSVDGSPLATADRVLAYASMPKPWAG